MSMTKKTRSQTDTAKSKTETTWSVRGVPYEAITAAKKFSAKEGKFLGQWLGEAILRDVAQRNNKTEIARPSDVDIMLVLEKLQNTVRALHEQVKAQEEKTKRQSIFNFLKRGG